MTLAYDIEAPPALMERYQRANNHYQPRLPYRGYFYGDRSHRSLDSLGGGNLKTHPVYLSKKLDPTERNLLLYSYFANRLGPAFEKRYYNNKQMEDLYEMEKRNFDEIDGSAFSPFKRQLVRH
uniref:CSON008840 protein n=1 Tax=Culicoides sonorensis TaxID=179676 RepID=A0A336LZW1_CULSO